MRVDHLSKWYEKDHRFLTDAHWKTQLAFSLQWLLVCIWLVLDSLLKSLLCEIMTDIFLICQTVILQVVLVLCQVFVREIKESNWQSDYIKIRNATQMGNKQTFHAIMTIFFYHLPRLKRAFHRQHCFCAEAFKLSDYSKSLSDHQMLFHGSIESMPADSESTPWRLNNLCRCRNYRDDLLWFLRFWESSNLRRLKTDTPSVMVPSL
jgi:hypothetical protein